MNRNEFILTKIDTSDLVNIFFQNLWDDIIEPMMSEPLDPKCGYVIYGFGLISDGKLVLPDDMELTWRELIAELKTRDFFNDKGIVK